jgi:hydrogenase expression/formation protein HypD
MKFVDEFRKPELIAKTAHEIRRLADPQRHYRMMEGVVGQALPPANPG